MNASERSDVDLLKATLSKYRKIIAKTSPHEATWDILKQHAKWLTVGLTSDNPILPSTKKKENV